MTWNDDYFHKAFKRPVYKNKSIHKMFTDTFVQRIVSFRVIVFYCVVFLHTDSRIMLLTSFNGDPPLKKEIMEVYKIVHKQSHKHMLENFLSTHFTNFQYICLCQQKRSLLHEELIMVLNK